MYRALRTRGFKLSILNDRIGANLGKIRVARGLSQEQLGKLVNLRYQQISLYENGKSNFNTETIEKLADALKVHPDAIIGAEVHTVCIEPTEDELIEKLKKNVR